MTREADDAARPDPAAPLRFPWAPAAVAAAATVFAAWLCVAPRLLAPVLTTEEFAALCGSHGCADAMGRHFRVRGVPRESEAGRYVGLRFVELRVPGRRVVPPLVVVAQGRPLPAQGETLFSGRLAMVDICGGGDCLAIALDTRQGPVDATGFAGLFVAAGTLAMFAWSLVTWRRVPPT